MNVDPGIGQAWWANERFGLFIHWGPYALAARGEWVKKRERLTNEHYQRYVDNFDPDLYDPRAWAQEAVGAGIGYAVVTTKHHDGYCLWDSALTDYTAVRGRPCRDLVRPFVEAFRAEGLRVGLYHSLLDWHHPEFPLDLIHPQADDDEFRRAAAHRSMTLYADYLHGQVRELLTNYGKIDVMWFDFSYEDEVNDGWSRGKGPDDWRSRDLLSMTRELQPGILVNDRLGIPGDFATPEQYVPPSSLEVGGAPVLWESCQTMNANWGYARDDADWKSADQLIRTLVDTVSKGGNLLLNVGPTGRGEIDELSLERLRAIGAWLRRHGRAIRGCAASPLTPPADCRYTQNGERLYLHLFAWPQGQIHLAGLAGRVRYAQLLDDASEVPMSVIDPDQQAIYTTQPGVPEGTLTLRLPVRKPDSAVPVIELLLDGL